MPADNPSLVVNPQVELAGWKHEGTVASITVRAPLKGSGLKITTIDRKEPATFGALLLHMITGNTPLNLPATEHARLRDIGFLVPADEIANAVWYSCDVLDPPLDLVPRRAQPMSDGAVDLRHLVVNPTLRQFGNAGPPVSMRGRVKLRNQFRTDRSWLWVQEADVCAPSLYSYSPTSGPSLDGLVAGEPAPEDLQEDTRRRLVAGGVLGSRAGFEERARERGTLVDKAARELHDRRYTVLPHVIAPLQLASARRYYRELIREGFLIAGDAEWPNRDFSPRDPIAHFFHAQLNDLVSEIAGAPLKPSFNYFASYRSGSVLPPHRDREQCEVAISILVDYSPEPDDLSPWPIFVQPPGASEATPVPLGIGDAVLYYGREVRHHRELLTGSEYSNCWFFFYVPQEFTGSLD
jgi:hypothetical protein